MRVRDCLPMIAIAALALTPLASASAAGKTTPFAVVHTFGTPDSHNPNSTLLLGTDGNFYGTTSGMYDGKDHGSTFRMDHDGKVTVLHTFTGADGEQPLGLVQAPDGMFYGVTQSGGDSANCPAGCGTVFSMTPSGDVTVLYSFKGSTVDGSAPNPSLAIAPDGTLFGTTKLGPLNPRTGEDWGTAFSLNPMTGAYAVMHVFQAADGVNPQGGLIRASDGNLYGVANEKGPKGSGTVFRLTPTGAFSVIHAFAGADGFEPKATLLQAKDGRLYGTTQLGGPANAGVIFRLRLSGAGFTVLHAFDNYAHTGYRPVFGLTQTPNGKLYGTTPIGGQPPTDPNRKGVVYRLSKQGTVTVLHTFTVGDGGAPMAAVTWGGDGHLYGTTFVGGDAGQGVAYRLL